MSLPLNRRQTITARVIRHLAQQSRVSYKPTKTDLLGANITRLAGEDVSFDPVEELLVALQRKGRITRVQMVRLQARYLRESRL